jgi:Glycoside hydrolase family 44
MNNGGISFKRFILLNSLLFSTTLCVQAANSVVYEDALSTGWENWSWSSTLTSDTALKYSGASSLAVTYTGAWAGVSFRTAGPINTTGYSNIQFAVYGVAGSGSLALLIQTTDSGANSPQFVFTPKANVWTVIEVPLTALGSPSQIARISIMDQTGAIQPAYHLDSLQLVGQSAAISLNVDAIAARKPISPLIYGINGISSNNTSSDVSLMQALGLTVRRMGGNDVSRYNWQLDASNAGADWFFENKRMSNATNLPVDSAVNRFIGNNKTAAASSIVTIPMAGFVAKDGYLSTCGFSVAKYGLQSGSDQWQPNCGTGIKPDGSFVTGNAKSDTSIAIGSSFATTWVNALVKRYGAANAGGVNFYSLDNEPDIWYETHRDVAPQALTYDQLKAQSYAYAAAIKAADTNAKILGPVVNGWTYYWHSPYDGQRQDWSTPDDRNAHGGTPLVPWYLQQMKAYELTNKKRILDYLDLHYYPQSTNVSLQPAGSAATQALRLESTRSLWDASYVDQSWIAQAGPDNGIVKLLPRMRDWVSTNYPGTKLAITEYNWGAPEHINGALAQADVLGIFGRESLDLATLFPSPGINQPVAFALRMYRNYDGKASKFGDISVKAISNYQGQLAIYAAEESTTGALTIMVINKTANSTTAPLTLSNFNPTGTVQRWQYSAAQLTQIVRLADQTVVNKTITSTFPANSITLYRIPGLHV